MRIFHPRPQPGRQKFIGVEFRDGVAEVDELHPERRLALTMHGYTIEESAPATPPEPVTLRDLSVAELREIARFEGVTLPAKAKKVDIIEALKDSALATIVVDGKPVGVSAHDELTPEAVIALTGLDAEDREARVVNVDGVTEPFDSAVPADGQQFVTYRTSAAD